MTFLLLFLATLSAWAGDANSWQAKSVEYARIMSRVKWTPVAEGMPKRAGYFTPGREYTGVPYSSVAIKSSNPAALTEAKETRLLVEHGFQLSRQLSIRRVLVFASLITDRKLVEKHHTDESLIWVTSGGAELKHDLGENDCHVAIPGHGSGMDRVTLALISAVLQGALGASDTIMCLVGAVGSKRLDNLPILNPKRDFRGLPGSRSNSSLARRIPRRSFG